MLTIFIFTNSRNYDNYYNSKAVFPKDYLSNVCYQCPAVSSLAGAECLTAQVICRTTSVSTDTVTLCCNVCLKFKMACKGEICWIYLTLLESKSDGRSTGMVCYVTHSVTLLFNCYNTYYKIYIISTYNTKF